MPVPSSRSTKHEIRNVPENLRDLYDTMKFQDFIIKIKLPFLHDRELYHSFYQILGFYPHDIYPYKVAMLHRSASQKAQKDSPRHSSISEEGRRINNERLEFLGDAILGAVVGHIVYKQFPKKPEGFLTNTRSNIVRRQSLNKLAQETGLAKLIISNYKQQTHNSYVNGNAFEALVGAIYLDRGYAHCVRFVREKIMKHLVDLEKAATEVSYKSKLIEWGQKHRIDVFFEVSQSQNKEASPIFLCRIIIGDTECGNGKGYSKKESQQMAAKEALARIRKDREFVIGLTAPKELQKKIIEPPKPLTQEEKLTQDDLMGDNLDIDFSSVTMKEKSREQIIAEAEAKAFAE